MIHTIMNNQQQEKANLTTILMGVRVDLVGRVLNTFLRYGYVLLLARLLGAHLMGIFFLGVIIIDICAMLSRMGLENGVLKYVAIHEARGEPGCAKGTILQAAMISVSAALIIAALLYFASDAISASIFRKSELAPVLRILALSLPFSSLMYMLVHATVAFHTLKYRAIIENMVNPLLNITLVLLFYKMGIRLSGVAFAYVIAFVACAGLAVCYLLRIYPVMKVVEIKPVYDTKRLMSFSAPLLFVGVLNLLMMWTDILMLGIFTPASDVGVYNTAVKTAFFINFIIISFTSIFAPRISELYHAGDLRQLQSLFKIISRWIFTLSLPLFIIMVFQAENLLWLFGERFTAGALSLSLLAGAHMLNAAVGSVRYMLTMAEREKTVMADTAAVCILNIVLNFLLIPRYGITGAATATSVSIVCINLIMLLQVFRYLHMHPYNSKYLKPLLSGIIVAFVAVFGRMLNVDAHPVLMLVSGALLYTAVYFALLRLFGFDEQDSLIMDVISKKMQ